MRKLGDRMRTHAYAMSIVSATNLTVREKVGLLRTDCYSKIKGEMPEEKEKLRHNFGFFARRTGTPMGGLDWMCQRLNGGFDRDTRVFWFSFDRDVYFNNNGKFFIEKFIAGLKEAGGQAVCIPNTPDWWGVFPMPRTKTQNASESAVNTPQSHEETQEVEEDTMDIPEPIKVVQERKVVRNIKRKKIEEIKLDELEEIDEVEE